MLTVVVLVVCLLRKPEANKNQQTTTNIVQPTNSESRKVADSPAANQSQAAVAGSQNTSTSDDIEARYRQGLISKDEAMLELQKRQLLQSQNFYG